MTNKPTALDAWLDFHKTMVSFAVESTWSRQEILRAIAVVEKLKEMLESVGQHDCEYCHSTTDSEIGLAINPSNLGDE